MLEFTRVIKEIDRNDSMLLKITISGSGPEFLSSMVNVSVSVGRDAALSCHISHSDEFKVAWIRVDTQTVLSFNEHVITKNHRIRVSAPEKNIWRLDISQVRRRDAGFYMCQINTDPMQSQLAYLDVVEPPSILSAGNITRYDNKKHSKDLKLRLNLGVFF